jgi:peptidyl-tRNA hydrolase, PTH1 family
MNYLVMALGNPGDAYARTRHNAGWIILDMIYPELIFERHSYAHAGVARTEHSMFVKPMTFMNESGFSLNYFIKKEQFVPEHCIVIYDDIDLPLGTFKISFNRGSGGHNGIRSIESYLGTQEFIRIRIGISKLLADNELVKPNVLGNFEAEEIEVLAKVAERVKKALQVIHTQGKDAAMNLLASF